MDDRLTIEYSRKSEHEADHPTIRERANQYRPDFLLRFQRQRRVDLEIVDAPDLTLELFNFAHFGEALDVANDDGGSQIKRPAITSLSQFTAIGLVTYASKPEAFASERKSSSWCAVTAMMGTSLSSSFLRMSFVAVKPSISGSVRSIRITSGFSRAAVSTATWPFSASKTMKPCSSSSRRMKRRVSSKSSTRRTFRSLESLSGIARRL